MGSPSTLLAEPMYGEDLSPKYAGHLCKVTDGPIKKKNELSYPALVRLKLRMM